MANDRLAVVATFDERTCDALASLYDALRAEGFVGEQTKDIPYHITLGLVAADRADDMAQRMDRVAVDVSPFELCLAHIGLFGLRVLFVAPNMNHELLALQERFFQGCSRGAHGWAAHATLLIDAPDAIKRALPIVAARFEPMRARIERVEMYALEPTRLVKTMALG